MALQHTLADLLPELEPPQVTQFDFVPFQRVMPSFIPACNYCDSSTDSFALSEPRFLQFDPVFPQLEAGPVELNPFNQVQGILRRRRQNAARPVCSLPTEIISAILLYFRNLFMGPYQCVFALLIITRVCHRLRQVALSLPLLWDHIDVKNPAMWRDFLSRSKSLPIDVYFNAPTPRRKTQPLLGIVLRELPRMRKLVIELDEYSDKLDDKQWTGLPAPYLEVLQVHSTAVCARGRCLLDLLLRGDRPCLMDLRAYNLDWHWMYTTLPRTLTSFNVTTEVHCLGPSLRAETLSTLRDLPLLKRLVINQTRPFDEWYPEDLDQPRQLHTPVSLPQLEELELQGPSSLFHLLDHLLIPPGCQKRLRFYDTQNAEEP
ncbi:hypothetical protein EIP86_005751 [Pleurotus ostreatoroseus]|nr:hypothetical protein EIP86_005751 [Pleurotus ostreatoroseus]